MRTPDHDAWAVIHISDTDHKILGVFEYEDEAERLYQIVLETSPPGELHVTQASYWEGSTQ